MMSNTQVFKKWDQKWLLVGWFEQSMFGLAKLLRKPVDLIGKTRCFFRYFCCQHVFPYKCQYNPSINQNLGCYFDSENNSLAMFGSIFPDISQQLQNISQHFPRCSNIFPQNFPRFSNIGLRENLNRKPMVFTINLKGGSEISGSNFPVNHSDFPKISQRCSSTSQGLIVPNDATATRQEPNDATAKASVQLTGPAATLLLEASDGMKIMARYEK